MNMIKQLRAQRMKALADSTAAPTAFFFEEPTLLVDDGDGPFQIYFYDMIDDWFGISAAMVVEALMMADGRDVLVHLDSPGGMVTEGLAIHSTLKQYSGDLTVRVEGLAASAASFVMLAGDSVLIEPNAMVMIHDAWDITIGPASEHRKTADLLDKVSDNIASMYATKAGTDAAEWRTAMLEETWYVGEEAVTAGLADALTEEPAEDEGGGSTGSSTAQRVRNEWSGIFAKAPRTTAPVEPDPPAPAPEPDPPADPVEPAPTPDPAPVPVVIPAPAESLEQLLAGIDLSAAMRTAFPSRGVPA